MQINKITCRGRPYPDHVHLLAVLHEAPDFGSYLLPHPAQVPEHTELLEGPVHLNAAQSVKHPSSHLQTARTYVTSECDK